MAITISSGTRAVRAGTFGAVQSLTVGTSTGRQVISPHFSITQIAGSTATSDPNETALFTLPGVTGATGESSSTGQVPVEGMEKWIKMTGTGPAAYIVVADLATGRFIGGWFTTTSDDQTYGPATGAFAFSNKTHSLCLKWMDNQWHPINGNASIGTGT